LAKLKTKSLSAPAAQSREQVEALIARAGEISRELQRKAADLGDAVALAKKTSEEFCLPLKVELESVTGLVQRWCEANRDALTAGKTKTVSFTSGTVCWRHRPPSVNVKPKIATVLEWMKANLKRKANRFIRVKEELDKEALLAAPAIVALIPGVTIGSAGEDFIIEPFGAELAEGVS
jgi:phage host-nuclease inhibitor protein Gam